MLQNQPEPEWRQKLDLTTCDQEPIHIPGSIQPHGIFFALSGPELSVDAVSANVAGHIGGDPAALLCRKLHELIDEPSYAAVTDSGGVYADVQIRLLNIRLNGVGGAAWPALGPYHAGRHSTGSNPAPARA